MQRRDELYHAATLAMGGVAAWYIYEASVCSRSAMISSISSIPTERRRRVSVRPRDSRISFGIEPWVIDAGWQTSDSTPPRLSARANTLKRRTIDITSAYVPLN